MFMAHVCFSVQSQGQLRKFIKSISKRDRNVGDWIGLSTSLTSLSTSLPWKFPRNRPIFPRFCPQKSSKIWLFFCELSEALIYVDLITLSPQPATTTGNETNNKKPATIESFDHWLEDWSAHEKTYLTHPARYAELAQYRCIIQKVNWKFRWKAVYDLTFNFKWVCPARLNGLTKLIPPYTPLSSIPLQFVQRAPPANIVSRTIIWYEIVPFVRNKRWRVKSCRKRAPQQCLNGNSQSSSKTASKDAICTREKHVNKEKTVNEPMFVRLVGGTTQLADCKLTSSS